ncbi:MAG TPA: PaaX family transcriptional regulator C-terminal domain-containing protein [Streptosporangiaceae bacterium]|nr:PaaX family transcriptional regulator C-terminal domain-containing protein [Streptosporangiaceae bacterium]
MATPAQAAGSRGLTLSRRHAAGAASARGLLFTVLGEFVLPAGGSAWTSAFIEAFARVGVEEKAIRQALARTAADGWIRPERNGRRTRWSLTPEGEQLLTEGTKRIYAFAGSQRSWDGSWLLVLARVPESDRAARHQLRTRLSWAGLGTPAPGIWITTHTERIDEVEHVLHQAGVADWQIFAAEHRGGGDLATLVGQAWDLAAIEQQYEEFLAEFASPAADDPLARIIELVHAWRRFPSVDPGLPTRLLPVGWSGARAAKLFAARHARWSPDAARQWTAVNEAAS